jgi:hypothetical protein
MPAAHPSLRHAIEMEHRAQLPGTFAGNLTVAAQAFHERREPEWKPM